MAVKRLEAREVPLSELTGFPGNPRRGNVAEIRRSLRRLGQYRSLVVRADGGRLVILAGNHTSKAMALEGWLSAWCEVVECTDDEARRVNLADNKLGELPDPDTGERYDRLALAEQLAYLDGDFEGTGWSADDADALLDDGDGDDGGDAGADDIDPVFGVIVECDDEQQQGRLLEQLDGEGFRVRALMS